MVINVSDGSTSTYTINKGGLGTDDQTAAYRYDINLVAASAGQSATIDISPDTGGGLFDVQSAILR